MRQLGWMGRSLFLLAVAVVLVPRRAAAAWQPRRRGPFSRFLRVTNATSNRALTK